MVSNRFIKNIIRVTFSNGIKFIAGVLTGLVLPMVFDVSGFGYFRLFALYLSYFGLFHFGFIDGIYILFGGKDYQNLDKVMFRAYTRFIMLLEVIISMTIITYALIVLQNERQLVFLLLGVNVFSSVITSYYQFISQTTSRFKEFSITNIVYGILTSLIVLLFFFNSINNVFIYLISVVSINFIILVSYVIIYKDITFGHINKEMISKENFFEIFKLGIPLLVGNFLTVLILNLPKQFVDWKFNIEQFAIFSFAYSLMNIANIFVASLSVVIYPTLKKVNPERFKYWYKNSTFIVTVLFSASLIVFFPLKYIINNYLVQYSNSIIILSIVFPGLIFSSLVQIVKLNYYKALNKMKQYISSGLITLIISLIMLLTLLLVNNMYLVAVVGVISLYLWHIITEFHFIKQYRFVLWKNELYLLLITTSFYLSVFYLSFIIGLFTFFIIYFVLSILLYKKDIMLLIVK